jgi:HlyD family secretion protein
MRCIVALLLLSAATPALSAQWFHVSLGDRPVTISTSGVVVSSKVQKFGQPPSRNWDNTIVELAAEGMRVKEGDVLARFNANNLDDRVRDRTGLLGKQKGELSALVEQQRREIEDEKVALAAAQSRAKKAERKASQPADLVAGMEYEKLVEERRIASLLLTLTKQQLKLSESLRSAKRRELEVTIRQTEVQLAKSQAELDSFTLIAPQPGLVIIGTDQWGNKLDVNQNSHPGMVIVELVDDTALALEAEFPENIASRLKVGQPVSIVVDAAGGAELKGVVSTVANTVRRQSRGSLAMVRDITVAFQDELTQAVRLGMSVQITVELSVASDAMAIPDAALVYRADKPGVILRGGDWQGIELGSRSGDMRIVLGGLNVGQEVRL